MEICACSGSNQMPKDVAIDQGSSAIVSSSDIIIYILYSLLSNSPKRRREQDGMKNAFGRKCL